MTSQDCQAIPQGENGHTGPVRDYIRICPIGHSRAGTVCFRCAGNGAIICDDCDGPALIILAHIWTALRRQATAPLPAPRLVHLLRDDFSHACGQDDRGYSSGVLAEVTCTACKEVT